MSRALRAFYAEHPRFDDDYPPIVGDVEYEDYVRAGGLEVQRPQLVPEESQFSPIDDALDQVAAARRRINADFSNSPRLPWDAVHDVLGNILPDHWWTVAAHTGNGKTTFLMQAMAAWVAEGRRVYVLPLEQPGDIMRSVLAALRCGYHTNKVVKNRWGELPVGAKAEIERDLAWQAGPGLDHILFSSRRTISATGFAEEMRVAANWGADIVILDHFHRVQTDGQYTGTVQLAQTIKQCTTQFRIPVLAAAQLNDRRDGGDPLAPFLPPKPTSIQGGEVIRQETDIAMGLFRPLAADFDKKAREQVRMGLRQMRDFLIPNCFGVNVLKDRWGDTFSHVIKLGFENGRITCPRTEDRLAYEQRNDL